MFAGESVLTASQIDDLVELGYISTRSVKEICRDRIDGIERQRQRAISVETAQDVAAGAGRS